MQGPYLLRATPTWHWPTRSNAHSGESPRMLFRPNSPRRLGNRIAISCLHETAPTESGHSCDRLILIARQSPPYLCGRALKTVIRYFIWRSNVPNEITWSFPNKSNHQSDLWHSLTRVFNLSNIRGKIKRKLKFYSLDQLFDGILKNLEILIL